MLIHAMPDLRKAVLAELDHRKWTRYRLVKELDGKLPAATVYQFLDGTSDIRSSALGLIFDALGLEPRRKR